MPVSDLSKSKGAADFAYDRFLVREFAADVRAGLSRPQKELHSKYLYDDLGSALFEAITHLPEYGLTRADERLLETHASDIVHSMHKAGCVIELGSGTGRKTRHVLAAMRDPRYFPIDVSADALQRCEHELADVAEIHPLQRQYLAGMAEAVRYRRRDEALLVLFLGSTIGNFERPCAIEFLRDLRPWLKPGDALLIGADLIKDTARMLLAYDDPTGVTGAFDLNILGRINRELGANFDLRNFEHQAVWNDPERRIEMHLRSSVDQDVSIEASNLVASFVAGETIWTESSHKFELEEMFHMAQESGFQVQTQWIDPEWPFVESLWMVP